MNSALLLLGGSLEDRFSMAVEGAKYMACYQGGRNRECGFAKIPNCQKSSLCQRIAAGFYPDVVFIRQPEEATIKVETIREVCHQMDVGAMEGLVKMCVIEECQRMTPAASNAFLKTLEEPRENRFFWLLTSHPGSLLPTLVSRCVSFRVPPAKQVLLAEGDQIAKDFELFLKQKDLSVLASYLDSKENCQKLVTWLQISTRDQVITKPADPFRSLSLFQELVSLEGRLRSNANYALMMENLLTEAYL